MSNSTKGGLFAGILVVAAWLLSGILIRPEWFGSNAVGYIIAFDLGLFAMAGVVLWAARSSR